MIDMTKAWLGLAVITMLASGGASAQLGREGGNTNTNGSMMGVNEDSLDAPAVLPAPAPVAVAPPSAPPKVSPRDAPGHAGRPGPRTTTAARADARPSLVASPAKPSMATPSVAPILSAEAPSHHPLETGTGSGNMNTNGSLMGLDDGGN